MSTNDGGFDEWNSGIGQALRELAMRLSDTDGSWLLGGSSGLWLQGVKLAAPPRDIDVYADLPHAGALHGLLSDQALDEPRLDESGLYISMLSHYRLHDYTTELVGGFRVNTEGARYKTEVSEVLAPAAESVRLGDATVRVMPLAHEFVFNVLRDRPDRYLAIAEVMRRQPERHLPLLATLLERNLWTAELVAKMAEMLDRPLLSLSWGALESN
ncbi:hypothetical protein V3851_00875 [Paenibacillus sp. M1]|uniref:Nucleotidyl transferase AbiEii/AbiGii toxin family protein n=1 Tax=Paenibacillus haidiansis TaxID=1574488 RepID=A0ABU7VNC1_9BACL